MSEHQQMGLTTPLPGARPTYMNGEVPAYQDVVRVDPLDRGRYADVLQLDHAIGRVFLRYHDFNEPSHHWCSVDRCELVSRPQGRRRRCT